MTTTISAVAPQVSIVSNRPVTTSLNIAEVFGKLHKNVLRDIQNLECSAEFAKLNFELCHKNNELQSGKPQPYYEITRDGFTFLVMGFTGKLAAQYKEQFIKAFNLMEEHIKKNQGIILQDELEIYDRLYKFASGLKRDPSSPQEAFKANQMLLNGAVRLAAKLGFDLDGVIYNDKDGAQQRINFSH